MKLMCRAWWLVLALPLLLVGCDKPVTGGGAAAAANQKAASDQKAGADQKAAADKDKKDDKKNDAADDEKEIKENLSKLSPEDRKIAEAQKYCPIEDDNRLGGEMGVPYKITLKGQTVFLCCKSCVKEANKDPDKTLAKVKELKAKAAKEKGNDKSDK